MKKKKKDGPLKLNLGCGGRRHEDFAGVDIVRTAVTDFKVDLFKFPWPWPDDSVDEVFSNQFFEHVPAKLRARFMQELWRVMKLDAKCLFITPHYASMRAVQDATHEWPPICEASYAYYNETWMRLNELAHYDIGCNFDYTYGHLLQPTIQARNDEARNFAIAHYINAVDDLGVTLWKRARLPKMKKEKK